MFSAKCPGQDRRNWKPEDIFEHQCPYCQGEVEFWKTDSRVKCPHCGEQIINPRFNLGCALWCAYAEQCVGDVSRIFTERPEALRDRLELEVRRYFIGESERFKFTLEAAAIASRLLEREKEGDPIVIIAAVLLHDIGYADCKEEPLEEGAQQSCIRQKSVEYAGKVMKTLKMPLLVQGKVKEIINYDRTKEAPDTNTALFLDIIDLTTIKLAVAKGSLPAAEKKELQYKLRRESSRSLAGLLL